MILQAIVVNLVILAVFANVLNFVGWIATGKWWLIDYTMIFSRRNDV